MQYNRKKDGSLEPLPATHVDTGMGLERLVRVMQNKTSNYDTDIFSGTIAATEKICGKKYTGGDDKQSVAFRVLADHIRAIGFTIADGQLPSNTGAGYVIRRILRRAVRYYYSYLDYKQPLLFKLIPVLAEQFREVFPELFQQLDFVTKVVKEEEEAFLRTLDKGLKRMDEIITQSSGKNIPGKEAFELYDTYGFPLDLTLLIATENNLTVDQQGFEQEMQQQKDRSRAATTLDTGDWIQVNDRPSNGFAGYDELVTTTSILRYRQVKNKGKEFYQLVLESTPFYAESGGQVGDRGLLELENGTIEIVDTKKENDLIIHFANSIPSSLYGTVTAKVNAPLRKQTTLHHSATHLLHAALRSVLGNHVAQKGSLVNEFQLRFDFSHFAKLGKEEILQIEKMVNQKIRENVPVVIKELPKEEALQLGAMALFGEKYGDRVRVVIMDSNYSVELCGGTHVGSTGEIGLFKLLVESAVAAGVRRVEAVCGEAAEQFVYEQLEQLQQVKELFKNPRELAKSVENHLSENGEMKKRLEQLEQKLLNSVRAELVQQKLETLGDIAFIGTQVEVSSADALKKLCFDLKNDLGEFVAVLTAVIGGKPFVAIGLSEGVAGSKSLDAGKLIKEVVAPLIKGGGGGQKTLATAGGQVADQLPQVIESIKARLQ